MLCPAYALTLKSKILTIVFFYSNSSNVKQCSMYLYVIFDINLSSTLAVYTFIRICEFYIIFLFDLILYIKHITYLNFIVRIYKHNLFVTY